MPTVVIKLMPDRKGILIHWFVRAPDGIVQTPGKTFPAPAGGQITLGGVRGYFACMPGRDSANPDVINGESHLVMHSDDIRAVSCAKCRATPEAQALLAHYGEMVESAPEATGQIPGR